MPLNFKQINRPVTLSKRKRKEENVLFNETLDNLFKLYGIMFKQIHLEI